MHKTHSLILAALTNATFKNKDVERHTKRLITTVGVELDEEGYEPGTDTEEAIENITEALNDADIEVENPPKSQARDEDEEEDEFAGLGDEDDEPR